MLLPRATQKKNTSKRMAPSAPRLRFGAINWYLGARESGLRSFVAIATRGITTVIRQQHMLLMDQSYFPWGISSRSFFVRSWLSIQFTTSVITSLRIAMSFSHLFM